MASIALLVVLVDVVQLVQYIQVKGVVYVVVRMARDWGGAHRGISAVKRPGEAIPC